MSFFKIPFWAVLGPFLMLLNCAPVVGDVVVHRQDDLGGKVRKARRGARGQPPVGVELELRVHHHPEVALLRHLAVLVDAVEEHSDLGVDDFLLRVNCIATISQLW